MNRSSPTNRSKTNTSPPSFDGTNLAGPSKRKCIAESSSKDNGEEEGQANKKSKSSNIKKHNNNDDYDSSSTTSTIVVAAPPKSRAGRAKTKNNNNTRHKMVTGYNLFIKEQLPIARAKSGQAHLRITVPMVAKKWNNLPHAKRQPYQDAAKILTQQLRQQQVQQKQKQQRQLKDNKNRTRRGKGGRYTETLEEDDSSSDDESEEGEDEESSTVLVAMPHGGRARRPAAASKENDDTEDDDDDDDDEILERKTSITTTTNNKRKKQVPPPPPQGGKKKKKRPYSMSAYNIFVQEQLPFAREECEEGVHLQFIIPHVAQVWREMDEHLRERYHEQSRLWKEQDHHYEDREELEEEGDVAVDQSSLGHRRSARASPPTDMFGFTDRIQSRDGIRATVDSGLLGNITNTGHGRGNRSRATRSNQNAHKQRANNLKKPPPTTSTSSPGAFSPYKTPAGYDDPLEEYFEDFILESAHDDAFLLQATADGLCLLQDTHNFSNHNGPAPAHVPHRAKSRNTDNAKHNCKKKIPAKKRAGDTFGTHSSDSSCDSSPFSQDSPESIDSSGSSSGTNIGSDDTNSDTRVGNRAYWKHPRGQVKEATAAVAATSRFTRPRGRPPVGAVFCTRTGKYLPL